MDQDGPALFFRCGARYMKSHIYRVQLSSPLKSEYSETQDKKIKAVNSQNNTENNVVNKTKSSSDDEDDNRSDLQMLDTPSRKNPSISSRSIKPNQIIKFKDSNDIECIWRV